jgi:hypothetical protein
MLKQLPRVRFLLMTVVMVGVGPLVVYFVFHAHGVGDTEALAIAWFLPVLWTLGSSIWRRRVDPIGLLGVAAYGLALAAAVLFGAGSLPLKLHRALITGAAGIVCLVSVAVGRPILVVLVRAAARSRGLGDAALRAQTVRRFGWLTVIVGAFCMADAAVHIVLAFVLPTPTFLIASTVIHLANAAAIAVCALIIFRFRPGFLGLRPPGGDRRAAGRGQVSAGPRGGSGKE